jgi:hypothetical protein
VGGRTLGKPGARRARTPRRKRYEDSAAG